MFCIQVFPVDIVNCRVGSLEIAIDDSPNPGSVNCRVGSLESAMCNGSGVVRVNCRVGSLEMGVSQTNHNFIRWFTLRVSAQAFRENGKHD